MDDGSGLLMLECVPDCGEIYQIELRASEAARLPARGEPGCDLDEVIANQPTGAGDPDD